jgi:hypothetical protein
VGIGGVDVTYAEFGQSHPRENRVRAAEAAIAFVFATYMDHPTTTTYLLQAAERLEEFAGEDVWLEVAHRARLLELGDEPNPVVVEAGVQSLKSAFDFSAAPNPHRWWRDVILYARRAAKRSDSGAL